MIKKCSYPVKALMFFSAFSILTETAWAERQFMHPGALDSRESLDFVKQRITDGDQPWTGELKRILDSGVASRGPQFREYVVDQHDSGTARDDAIAAYAQALMWSYTSDESYAQSAVDILNTWSNFQGFTLGTDQDKLRAGWIGAVLAQAAEIMQAYKGWKPKQIGDLQAMFRRAYYPQLKTVSHWNGNVDLTQIDAMISIAVFNEDEALFDMALKRFERRLPAYIYLKTDGGKPRGIEGDGGNLSKFWSEPVEWTNGLNQESCRDNGHHSQYGVGSALHVAEVAWNQGVDIYTPHQNRLTAALELMAEQLLTGEFASCREPAASKNRFNTWEVGYNHYHNRAGIDLPYTHQLIMEQIRTDSQRATWNLVYETLTHADLPGRPTKTESKP